jgi:hypothetical protein
METVLGLLGVVAYILGVLTLAASVTYLVVKLSPARDRPKDAKS